MKKLTLKKQAEIKKALNAKSRLMELIMWHNERIISIHFDKMETNEEKSRVFLYHNGSMICAMEPSELKGLKVEMKFYMPKYDTWCVNYEIRL